MYVCQMIKNEGKKAYKALKIVIVYRFSKDYRKKSRKMI